MHYYLFNIGDYQSHTKHLDLFEDLAYRRLLDWCYLHERSLPDNIDEIARLICMRSHTDCIARVLQEYFVRIEGGWSNERVNQEIQKVNSKSEKAKKSAMARWNANALQTQSESNATQDPLPKTQDTVKTTRGTRLPSDATLSSEYQDYCQKTRPELDPDQLFEGFRDYWIAQPGQKGVKLDWFATWRTWVRNQKVTQTTNISKKPNFGGAI